jgi:hypothetical protein
MNADERRSDTNIARGAYRRPSLSFTTARARIRPEIEHDPFHAKLNEVCDRAGSGWGR